MWGPQATAQCANALRQHCVHQVNLPQVTDKFTDKLTEHVNTKFKSQLITIHTCMPIGKSSLSVKSTSTIFVVNN